MNMDGGCPFLSSSFCRQKMTLPYCDCRGSFGRSQRDSGSSARRDQRPDMHAPALGRKGPHCRAKEYGFGAGKERSLTDAPARRVTPRRVRRAGQRLGRTIPMPGNSSRYSSRIIRCISPATRAIAAMPATRATAATAPDSAGAATIVIKAIRATAPAPAVMTRPITHHRLPRRRQLPYRHHLRHSRHRLFSTPKLPRQRNRSRRFQGGRSVSRQSCEGCRSRCWRKTATRAQ